MSSSYLTMVDLKDLLRLSLITRYRDNALSRHRMVMALFPQDMGEAQRAKGKILFRGEKFSNRSVVIIRSNVAPANLPGVRSIAESFENLEEGGFVKFRVTVTPITRQGNKEIAIRDFNEIEEWFTKRVGETLSDIEIVEYKNESIYRDTSAKNSMTLFQLDGVAKIVDVEKLKELLVHGVGRNKNYGAGLMTVRQL